MPHVSARSCCERDESALHKSINPYHTNCNFRNDRLHSATDKEKDLQKQQEFVRLLLETTQQLPVPSPPNNIPSEKYGPAYLHIESQVLHGETEKAVEYAIKNGMWAHALVLSSTVGRKCYQQTVEAFTLQRLPIASPLSAIFRQSVGAGFVPKRGTSETPTESQKRRQQAAQCLVHWRAQLAGLMNNPKGHEATKGQIVKLGDALLDPLVYSGSLGPIGGVGTSAAHVCYLAAGT